MSKVNCTVWELRNYVTHLRIVTLQEFDKTIDNEFYDYLEENPEIAMDIAMWESLVTKAQELQDKYKVQAWERSYLFEKSNLRVKAKEKFQEKHKETKEKIVNQFKEIQEKLSCMRSPNKAVEFLKVCGIELPKEISNETVAINIDIEFLKSVLPSQKLLENKND